MSERDRDLPVLDELAVEFEALVSADWAADGDRHAVRSRDQVDPRRPPPRRRAEPAAARGHRARRIQLRRIGRRAVIVLVLLCLIGGGALAALRGGGDSGGHANTAPTPLGRAADGAWVFSAYRDAGRLCTDFVPRGGELSGNCGAPPGRGRVRAASALADGHRYVFGVAGPRVGRVAVTLAGGGTLGADETGPRAAGPVRIPIDRGAAGNAGFPAGARWFVLDLGPVHSSRRPVRPAVVTPLTRAGRRAGPSYVDCSLGVVGRACERRIEAAAAAR